MSVYPHYERPHFVYRCYDATGRLIYVGCTSNPVARLAGHTKSAWWANQIDTVRLIVFPSRRYALDREREAIASENPRWNVRGRWPAASDWTVDDYLDYRRAIVQAVESTHRVYGVNTRQLLLEVDEALAARFGLRAIPTNRSVS